MRFSCKRATRSRGRNGQSQAALSTHFTSGRFAAVQSSAARMPASGPGKPGTSSAMTCKPNAAKRAGSPLALRISPLHWGDRRAITRSRMVRPPMVRIGLSPPPIRRARPPASSTPCVVGKLVVTTFTLALVLGRFFLDVSEVLVVDDALCPRQRDEPFAAGAADQRQAHLPGEIDTPGGEAGARHQDRNSHADSLDHHLRGEPSGGIKDLVGCIDAVAVHPACDLVDGVV